MHQKSTNQAIIIKTEVENCYCCKPLLFPYKKGMEARFYLTDTLKTL